MRTQLPWMKNLKPGDVLYTRGGDLRVVRAVTRFENGDLKCIDLVIRKCSWTHRPYTVLNYTDLRHRGFGHTGLNIPLDKEFQKKLGLKNTKPSEFDCCDVKGIP